MAAQQHELDQLLVKVMMDANDFAKGANDVIAGMSKMETAAIAFATKLSSTATTGLGKFSTSLSNIGFFLDAVTNADFGKIGQSVAPLKAFSKSFLDMTKDLQGADAKGAGRALGNVANVLDSFRKFSVAKDYPKLAAVAESIKAITSAISSGSPEGMEKAGAAFSRVSASMTRLAKVDPASVQNTIGMMSKTMTALNAIPITANAQMAARIFSQAGYGMNMMARAAGAGVPPPPINMTLRGLLPSGGLPSAISSGASSMTRFGETLRGAFTVSEELTQSLDRLRMGMLALAGVGIKSFADLDDSITRTLVHMRDFAGANRDELTQGVRQLSGSSTNSAVTMAKGLDILASSGMSAAMALKALAISEDFAVASGLKTDVATRKLVDIMQGMGLAVADVDKHKENMRGLADVITGMSARVGSTESQFADAFSSRFMEMAYETKLSLQDSAALLGSISRMGTQFRGSAGGTLLSRALLEIKSSASTNSAPWKAMFGEDGMAGSVFDAKGELKSMIDVLDVLLQKLGDPKDNLGFTNRLKLLGLNNFRVEPLISSMVRAGVAIKDLQVVSRNLGGTSKDAADMIRDNLSAQIQILWNNAYNAAGVVGQIMTPAIRVLGEAVKSASDWFQGLNPAFQNLIVLAGALFVAFKPAVWLLSMVGSTILSVVLTPLKLMYHGLWAIVEIPSLIARGFMWLAEGVMAVWGVMKSLWDTAKAVGSVLGSVFNFLGESLVNAVVMVRHLAGAVITAFNATVRWVSAIASDFIFIFGSLAASIIPMVTTGMSVLLLSVVAVAVFLPMIASGLAVVGALAGAMAITLGGVIQLIGMGFVAAWNVFKSAASSAMGVVGRGFELVHASASDTWKTMREGAAGFMESFARAATVMAGFFWNFKQNALIIWEWMGKHGEKAFGSLMTTAFNVVEVIVKNIVSAFTTAFRVLSVVFSETWGAISSTFMENIGPLLDDLGSIFQVMGQNFIHNFGVLFANIDRIFQSYLRLWSGKAIALAVAPLGNNPAVNRELKEAEKLHAGELKIAMWNMGRDTVSALEGVAKLQSNMPMFKKAEGVFDAAWDVVNNKQSAPAGLQGGMGGGERDLMDKFTRPFERMIGAARMPKDLMGTKGGVLMDQWNSPLGQEGEKKWADKFWAKVGTAINSHGFTGLTEALKPITDDPAWKLLADTLNLALPPDAMQKSMEFFKGIFNPQVADQAEAGNVAGKGGPGWQFKQISLERMMVGGSDMESLQAQQLSIAISSNNHLRNIADAVRDNPKAKGKSFKEQLMEAELFDK